ncbi:MAG: HD domain-containing response regulator [Bacillota bacterium]|nr:HD domain-containing response regulator [Bacillota bacterium]
MRLSKIKRLKEADARSDFRIIGIDDEAGIIDSLKIILEKQGYEFEGYTDHEKAIEMIKNNHYDLLILDYLLDNIKGSQVVELIREFNKELYILLLTGHSEAAPPLETLEKNDIQGYCLKSNDSSQLLLMVKSAYKAVEMMNEIKLTRDGLNSMLKAVPKIYQIQPIDLILEEILKSLLPIIGSTDAFILVDSILDRNMEARKESFFKGIGKFDTDINSFVSLFNPILMEYAGSARIAQNVVRYEEGVFFPLLNENKESMGVIYVEVPDNKNLKLLEIYANQAASSLNNAFLHSMLNIKNEELKKTYEIIRTRYEETINTLRLTVDAKDEYTRGHSDRVAEYAVELGRCFDKLGENDLHILKVGGIFHDIGKIGTTDDILLADRKLSREEFEEIEKHPVTGANILSALSMFSDIVPLVMYHHERIDGTGYPKGLKDGEIPFLARILSIADAFDAMTTNRAYRRKMSVEDAINQLVKGAGTQFDSEIVDVFIKLLKSGNFGS